MLHKSEQISFAKLRIYVLSLSKVHSRQLGRVFRLLAKQVVQVRAILDFVKIHVYLL